VAESFAPFPYVEDQLVSIEGALASERLARYVRAANGDRKQALRLYLYNARLAKACLFPLGMAEVVLRNAISRCLAASFGPEWFRFDPSATGIAPSSLSNLKSVVERLEADKRLGSRDDRRSEAVTSLPFEFWCGVLRSSTERLWQTCLRHGFANLKSDQGRQAVSSLASKLSRFRNRVVHHEPIFEGWDLQAIQGDAIELIRMVCEDTAFWVKHHSTVMHAIRSKPERPEAFEPLSARSTRDFTLVEGSWTVEQVVRAVRSEARVIAVGGNRIPYRCLWVADVLKLLVRLNESGSAGALSRSVWEATEALPKLQFVVMPGTAPYATAEETARDRDANVIFSASEDLITGVVILQAPPGRR